MMRITMKQWRFYAKLAGGTFLNSIQTQWYISQKLTGIGHARFV